ncbi:Phosphate import ATP-binding protein PstB [Porphyromonas levii]|nr:phosphate ABC transporter ATP-binding protein PstB [Porphyromonas levii]MBR8703422.1 Phosphate import ATP-binding protein PstB [Porphyromonas levii]MBR8760231.1 Phosphate import ATP-binding protein PstB [Porphyromonas levii]MBR8773449.1 Phosphate import ATP-binding protein PstB [Porphyromonas levii]MBR8806397.1 Phosphate import ATP-binding protein PstB [Porphyromonas levii]
MNDNKTPLGGIPVADGLLATPSISKGELTPIIEVKNLSVSYSPEKKAIKDVDVTIYKNLITAVMGPSGCGKSTLLRAINRMHDLYPSIKVEGQILIDGEDMLSMDPMLARRRAGMVFQRPNPFPTMSIEENVLAGYKLNGIKLSKDEREEIVQTSLESVALWDEVKDSMKKRGSFLSGGQQQRLCIARALALRPEVLLMDEPTSALDPISTNRVEELIFELKQRYTIVIVTHNMSQAARLSDKSVFMYLGELIEYGDTEQMFTKPKHKQTEDYLTGVFS